jgi:hypothetical protein
MYRADFLMIAARELKEKVTFCGNTRGQMGQRWHQTSMRICICLREGK